MVIKALSLIDWLSKSRKLILTLSVVADYVELSKLNYIHENPVRAGWVTSAEDYLYSSARNFAELDCLLQIDAI